MAVVLRHSRRRRLAFDHPEGEPFAAAVAAALAERLPAGWSLQATARERLRWLRAADGAWRIEADAGLVAVDDLAVGAAAARHLVAIACQDLRFAGGPADSLRWRGFAIAAGALGCRAQRLGEAALGGGLGIFCDGALAEVETQGLLTGRGLVVPRDALLLGVEDGHLPAPALPGLSRLRLDPQRVAMAAIALLRIGAPRGRILIAPDGVITRASSEQTAGDPRLTAALAHLAAHLHLPLDVELLALAAGMPRRSLERLFRRQLGRSPLDEIRRQRIARAQELLAHSDLPLDDIAQRVGISSAERLGVVFKQLVGCSPGQWRREQGGN